MKYEAGACSQTLSLLNEEKVLIATFILEYFYGNTPFIFGLSGMVIKVALHCGTAKTEYNGTWNEVLEALYYFIHLHRNLSISLSTYLKGRWGERFRE